MIAPRNILLAASTAAKHVGDDPVLLASQLVRRLPRRLSAQAPRLIRSIPTRSTRALGAYLTGDGPALERALDTAVTAGVRRRTAAVLADVALTAHHPVRADALLELAGPAPATRARRRWYDGDMTGAVEELQVPGHAAMRRRLQSELRVYQGWSPSVTGPSSYTPVSRTVLHVLTNSLPHTGSGYAQRSHSLLQAQAESGWAVHAVTRLGYPVQVGKLTAGREDRLGGVTYHRLLPAIVPTGFDARIQRQTELVLRLALDLRPAVLHTTTDFLNGLITREVARALGIPWVYEVRGQLVDTWASVRGPAARGSEKYRLFQDREAEVMKDAGLVVTLGHAMKDNLEAVGVRGDKILLLPNAVGGDFLTEPPGQTEARHAVGLETRGQYIGTVSSLVPYEGLRHLIKAFVLLAADHPELRLLIVGDGVAGPSLREQAERSGYADRIIFTGRVPRDLAVSYHRALDVFAVPREDLEVTRSVTPLKPVEALACARPVVASDLSALREIVEDGVTGILTEAGNAAALADALATLLADPRRAADMGRAGRARMLEERTWAANAVALNDELDELGVSVA
ncbi:glycosyltransferase [Arthrobacter echini]|uniref:D-inositol 3-phosphate glycosyltransferase n=1 Tax=Arthrobacter echini TaxID=1529066 RepID=A0A4S5E0Y1_9MICC|nr:glycosyltransferase family 4 protein [Arthrobacter echini]THJ64960.1 glycosyltransferase [Arthrobacter echini]